MKNQVLPNDCKNLKWVDWDGDIPTWAVSIENQKFSRTDYVSVASQNSLGFYTPSKGPYCFYPLSDKEFQSSSFKILINVDNFERLEWKSGSWGSIPNNAICYNPGVYVGKNQYGLGKVVSKFKAFFLPCDGKEYCYKMYEVLTVSKDYHIESITDVQYQMEEGTAEYGKPLILEEATTENRDRQEVKRTVTIQQAITYQHRWDADRPATAGVSLHFRAHSPNPAHGPIGDFVYKERSQGIGMMSFRNSEIKQLDEKVEVSVQPNHACQVVLEGREMTAHIPYHAKLSRTYRDGQMSSTTIQGVYTATGFDIMGIKIKSCHLLSDE